MLIRRSKILLALVLLLALALRVCQLQDHLLFVYDQGRDAFTIAGILKGRFTLIGPTTGLQGFFLGPFFYYFLTPWYYLSKGDPLLPAYFLQFFNLLFGGYFIYKLLKKVDPKLNVVLVFTVLGFSFYHWNFSKWLSNPSPIISFAPLYFYLLYLFIKEGRFSYLAGLVLSVCLQTEFSNAVFFLPVSFLAFLIGFLKYKKTASLNDYVYYLLGVITGIMPLVLFNFRHDNIIINSLLNSFSESKNVDLWQVWKTRPFYIIGDFSKFIFGEKKFFPLLLLPFLFLKKQKKNLGFYILLLWLFVPLFLVLFYTGNEGNFWDYYLISQYLAFLLFFILMLSSLAQLNKYIFAVVLSLFLLLNLRAIYFGWLPENNNISLGSYKKVVERVYELASGKDFNLEVYVPNLQPIAYQYLFDWYGSGKYNYIPSKIEEKQLFFVLEPGNDYWREDWLKLRENDGVLSAIYKVGIIEIQKRTRE